MKKIGLLLISVCLAYTVFAQDKQISGVIISSEDNLPMPGVTIVQKGTTNGTTTDIDGKYSITVPKGAVLQITYVGMESMEVTVGDQNAYNITMNPEALVTEEFVVVGYGTMKRKDNTGSQATVKSEQISKISTSSLADNIQGTSAGVQIRSANGLPGAKGSLAIRGKHSISLSSDPLYIIDGVEMHGGEGDQDPMSLINQNDIESIDILKDAKATAIYGSRGSAGVVIITTKGGMKEKAGKSVTNISLTTGISVMSKNPEKMNYANTEEYFKIVDKARLNSAKGNTDSLFDPVRVYQFFKYTSDDPVVPITREQAMNTYTNWFDEVLTTGTSKELNFSNQTSFEKASIYVSANYKDMKSVVRNNDFKSVNTRINIDYEPVKNIRMGNKMSFGYTHNNQVNGGAGYGGNFGLTNREPLPWFPMYNPDHPSGYWNPMSGYNIKALNDRNLADDRSDQYRAISNNYFEFNLPWHFTKGLKFRTEANFDFMQSNVYQWTETYLRKDGSNAIDDTKSKRIFLYNAYFNYTRDFGTNHSVTAAFGTEAEQKFTDYKKLEADKLTTSYHYIGGEDMPPEVKKIIASSLSDEEYFASYFARADYKFKERYLIAGSYRRDASSKFDKSGRWGDFMAGSLGWIVSEENFFKSVGAFEIISLLKIRGSFGQTGNNKVDKSVFKNKYTNKAKDNIYGTSNLIPGGTTITNVGNPYITWETTNSLDFGVDYGFVDNRFEGSVAYYSQRIDDLLLETPMPESSPVEKYWKNVGSMKNFGYEFNINAVVIDKPLSKFKYKADFNISSNENQVLKIIGEDKDAIIEGGKITMVGQEIRTFYMAEWAGLDRERGVDLIYEIDQDVWKNEQKIVKTGRKIPATKTNMENNKVVLEGKSESDSYFGGLGNKFELKNFDFGFRVTFAGGGYRYDYIEQRSTIVGTGTFNLNADLLNNTWTPENTGAKYPQLVWGYKYRYDWDEEKHEWIDYENPSDPNYDPNKSGNYSLIDNNILSRYLYRDDYIRLKSIEIGYNFPKTFTSKLQINSLRLYGSISNLWVYAFYYKTGWDPEAGESTFPQPRTFMMGFNIGL